MYMMYMDMKYVVTSSYLNFALVSMIITIVVSYLVTRDAVMSWTFDYQNLTSSSSFWVNVGAKFEQNLLDVFQENEKNGTDKQTDDP